MTSSIDVIPSIVRAGRRCPLIILRDRRGLLDDRRLEALAKGAGIVVLADRVAARLGDRPRRRAVSMRLAPRLVFVHLEFNDGIERPCPCDRASHRQRLGLRPPLRGNPSRMKPRTASGCSTRSSMSLITMSSEHKLAFAHDHLGLLARHRIGQLDGRTQHISGRQLRNPEYRLGMRRADCVPLPAPGGPSRINLIGDVPSASSTS